MGFEKGTSINKIVYTGSGNIEIDMRAILLNDYTNYSSDDFVVHVTSVTAFASGHSNSNASTEQVSIGIAPSIAYNNLTGLMTITGCHLQTTAYSQSLSGNYTNISITAFYDIIIK